VQRRATWIGMAGTSPAMTEQAREFFNRHCRT
jgi:hypothetical protein